MAHKKSSSLKMYTDSSGYNVSSHPSKSGAVATTSKSSYGQKPFKGNSGKGKPSSGNC